MDIHAIDDPLDPRVGPYRNIREADLVGRQGRFVAEGKVVLQALLRSPSFEAESVLVLQNRLSLIAPLLEASSMPFYVASRQVIDAIAGFPMHRGILAIGRRTGALSCEAIVETLPQRATVVVLVGLANHDNVGAVFRNAAAFGADAVLLDPTCCDPLYRKAIRVSVGGVFQVPFARFGHMDALVARLAAASVVPIALSPSGRESIADFRRERRVALLLGTEGEGLPVALLETLRSVRIPIVSGFDSLNVAAASAIALHRLSGAA